MQHELLGSKRPVLGPEDTYASCLLQVVYRSRYLTDAAGEADILDVSRRNNPARDITGVLDSHGGWFMQVLEGPAQALSKLLDKIRDDTRNGDFLLLRATPIAQRDFAEWSMASTQVDADQFVDLLDDLMFGHGAAIHMLQDFIINGRWRTRPDDAPCPTD